MKLTNYWCERIENKMVDYAFEEKKRLMKDKENKLALEVYYFLYPMESLSFETSILKMKDLPDDWLPERNRLWLNAGGYSVALCMDKNYKFPYNRPNRYNITITNQELINKIQSFVNDKQNLDEEISNFTRKIKSFLMVITTDKMLFTEMPDAVTILGNDFFGVTKPSTALVTTAKEIMCQIAYNRNEERENCCDGNLVEA